jgi:hypothetical protein
MPQVCFDFILGLCKSNPAAQRKFFPMITIFSEHVGIENLNVADTIAEIVRDNAPLIAQVPEVFFRNFIEAIQTFGRKARWLRFFEVFLEINGAPFKRNQVWPCFLAPACVGITLFVATLVSKRTFSLARTSFSASSPRTLSA